MRILLLIILLISQIFATKISYKAKLEPKELYSVKSEVNGKVIFAKKEYESSFGSDEVIIQIDDYQDKINLENAKAKLKHLSAILVNINKSIKNSQEIIRLKSNILNKINSLKSKSEYEKNLEEIGFKSFENSYFSLLQQKEQTKMQIDDLKANIKLLEDSIKNKSIKINKNLYIYEVSIKKDDFASVGKEVLKVADLSKAKITLFLSQEELIDIDKKTIYIDNQKTNYKIDKIWKVTDTINISSYRVEILINSPKFFSKVVEVSFK